MANNCQQSQIIGKQVCFGCSQFLAIRLLDSCSFFDGPLLAKFEIFETWDLDRETRAGLRREKVAPPTTILYQRTLIGDAGPTKRNDDIDE